MSNDDASSENSDDSDVLRGDLEGFQFLRKMRLKEGLEKRFARTSYHTYIQDNHCCGAGEKCKQSSKILKDDDIQYSCIYCERVCHKECVALSVLDHRGQRFERPRPHFYRDNWDAVFCFKCARQLHRDKKGLFALPLPPVKTPAFIVLDDDLRQECKAKLEAWKDMEVRLPPPDEFDRQVREAFGNPIVSPFAKYANFERAMDQALEHMISLPESDLTSGLMDDSIMVVACPTVASLQDISQVQNPDLWPTMKKKNGWRPPHIAVYWEDIERFQDTSDLRPYCDPTYQLVVLVACKVRSSSDEVICKAKIISNVTDIPQSHIDDDFESVRRHNLSFQASRLAPLRATSVGAFENDTFEEPACSFCGRVDTKSTDNDDGDEEMKRCNACKAVRYCSKECQDADWQHHQYVCELRRVELSQAKKFLLDQQQKQHVSRTKKCGYCGAQEEIGGKCLRTCDICKSILYCGRDCQSADWEAHQYDCWLSAETTAVEFRDKANLKKADDSDDGGNCGVGLPPKDSKDEDTSPAGSDDESNLIWPTCYQKNSEDLSPFRPLLSLGKTDYMDGILQVLFCSVPFRRGVITLTAFVTRVGSLDPLLQALVTLGELFTNILENDMKSSTSSANRFVYFYAVAKGIELADAREERSLNEFYVCLLDALALAKDTVGPEGLAAPGGADSIMYVNRVTTTACSECGRPTSETEEHFCANFEFEEYRDLEASLEATFSPSRDIDAYCRSCHDCTNHVGNVKLDGAKLPALVMFDLFPSGSETDGRMCFSFPKSLNLAEYCAESNKDDTWYSLRGAVLDSGGCSVVRIGTVNSNDEGWLKFTKDGKVNWINYSDIEKETSGRCVMLFYEKDESI